jgi:hypothetical protein
MLRLTNPVVLLWLAVLSFPVIWTFTSAQSKEIQNYLFSGWLIPALLAAWITSDAQKRGKLLCQDFDTFVFFGWPLLLPIYLFQTRRFGAFRTLLWAMAMCAVYALEFFLLHSLAP